MKYIGLDIGDGESAATLVWDEGTMLQEVLTLGSAQSILSVVAMLGDRPIVGSAALTNPHVKERKVRFKSKFLSEPDSSDIRRFAEGIHAQMSLTAAHALSGKPEDIRVALGCPAGWDSLARKRYADVVENAGFPNVYTVSESRAAYLYVHYDKSLQISASDLQKPCLVIDIGSSTTDFAYIVDGKESNVGIFGQNHLGAGLLDRLILADAILDCTPDEQKRLSKIFAQYPSWYSYCELEARKQKEAYFLHEAHGDTGVTAISIGVFADINHPIYISVSLDKKKMDRLLKAPIPELGRESFVKALHSSLERARQYASNPLPEWLILTGGASRMGFFQEACRAAFPEATVLLCPQPEFSIARGLGIAGYIDHRLSCLRAELTSFFNGDALKQAVSRNIHKLNAVLFPKIADIVLMQGFIPALKLASKEGLETQEDFFRFAEGYMEEFIQDEEKSLPLKQIVQAWLSASLAETQKTIDKMCAAYDVDSASLKLSELPIKIDLNKMKFPWLFRRLLILLGFSQNEFWRDILAMLMRGTLASPSFRKKLQKRIENELLKDGQLSNQIAQNLTDALRGELNHHIEEAEIMLH